MAQARLKPLDNAEQDYVLRQRLSHPLSHRPLLSIKSKLAALKASEQHPTDPSSSSSAPSSLHAASLVAELQSYLVSLTRTSLSSTSTTATQVAEYEQQYAEIQAQEAISAARIVDLKQQLEEVRRRRREKIEYGRVAESVERWFKTGSVHPGDASAGAGRATEIEDSLSTLVSHLTSSFLYKSGSSPTDQPPPSTDDTSPPDHTATLTLLHSKLDEMLNLSRQVREIVGWKSGPSGGGGSNAITSSRDAPQPDDVQQHQAQYTTLNPNAKPFQPTTSAAGSSTKRQRSTQATTAADENESAKKQKVSLGGQDEDDDEEGSIPAAASATATAQSVDAPRKRGPGANTTAAAAPARGGRGARGRGRGGRGA